MAGEKKKEVAGVLGFTSCELEQSRKRTQTGFVSLAFHEDFPFLAS